MRTKKKRTTEPRRFETTMVLSITPKWLAFCAFLISFALPNLVFSGDFFYQTLHLMKWVTTLLPLAIVGIIAGYRTARYGTDAVRFRLDGFALLWLLLLLFTALQPLWADVRSMTTFLREWFFFSSLWLVYVLTSLLADKGMLKAILWGALLNAAINVLFAELQRRGMSASIPFIAPLRLYVGNTGQQNMFGFWMAISGLGGFFLFLSSPPFREKVFGNIALFALTTCVFWGAIASASRSGILSLGIGCFVLSVFYLRREGRKALCKIVLPALLCSVVLVLAVNQNPVLVRRLLSKTEDMVQQPLSIAKRDTIWATAWTMFAEDPWRGVGLGQFKWNYLDAHKQTLKQWPSLRNAPTQWAHNEFLQWAAEGGVVGALLMFSLWAWWGISAARAFFKRTPISPEAIWGSSLVACFFFNALWTRPFHRAENVVWLALAFAVTNREVLMPKIQLPSPGRFNKAGRLLGAAICLVSILGALYLGDGVRGDRMLRIAMDRDKGNAETVLALHRKAYSSFMVRDLAEKHIAYFFIELGQAVGNDELVAEGLNALVRYFQKQPHVEDLKILLNWAYHLNNMEFRRYIESFVPGQ